jgi:hypothetical protein
LGLRSATASAKKSELLSEQRSARRSARSWALASGWVWDLASPLSAQVMAQRAYARPLATNPHQCSRIAFLSPHIHIHIRIHIRIHVRSALE